MGEISIIDPEVAEDPHAFYEQLRRRSPVWFDSKVGAYLVSTYDLVASVYRDPKFSTGSYTNTLELIHGRTVLSMDGREHAKNRALLTPHFRGKGLELLHGLIHATAAKILSTVVPLRAESLRQEMIESAEQGSVDLVASFAHKFPVAVIADMLGLPEEDHELFSGWYGHIMDFVGNFSGDPKIHDLGLAAKRDLAEYMTPLILERRESPGTDLVSAIVISEVDGYRMSDEEVRSYISLLLTAGGETTDKAFGSMCKNLLSQDLWGSVRDDRQLVTAAIAETLRFSPPSQITSRLAEEDTELGGVRIPAGSTLFLLAGSANRDGARFSNPNSFDIRRSDLDPSRAFSGAAGHLAFGFGRHFCLGAMLAKTEMEVGLNMLLDQFPNMTLSGDEEPRDVGLKTRGPDRLLVNLH